MTSHAPRAPFRDSFAFELAQAGRAQRIAMAIVVDDDIEMSSLDLLHDEERALLPAPRYAARRRALIRGREAAKSALRLLHPQLDPAQVAILPGEKGRPLVTGSELAGVGVSLSHISGASVAVAFPETCPIGIDWERIDPINTEALKRVSRPRERAEHEDDLTVLTRLWTLKEALAKVVRTGFSVPVETFETTALTQTDGVFHAAFTAFPQHIGTSVSSLHLCLALVTRSDVAPGVLTSQAMARVRLWLETSPS